MAAPSSLHTTIRTAIGLFILIPGLFLTSVVAFTTALLGGSQRRSHDWGYLAYCRLAMKLGGTHLLVEGREKLDPSRAYVVVPNHASNWDPPLIVAVLGELVLRFVIKDEIMKIPVFGHALKKTGNVHVIRRRAADDVKRIDDTMAGRDPAVSVLFFAEGTRSDDGKIREFKKGAFATALGYKLPILPVAIAGTHEVWPKGKLQLRPGPVCVEIGDPIETDGLAYDDREALRQQTEGAVRALHARAEARRLEIESS